MAVEIVEHLSANVVLLGTGLLSSEEEVKSFGANFPQEVHYEIFQNVDGTRANRVSIRRENITIELVPGQSIINKGYPSGDDWQRLAEVASLAICESSKLDLRARGYNYHLVIDQSVKPTAYEYITTQVVKPLTIPGWQPIGGLTELRFLDDGKRQWNVKIEPRLRDDNTSKLFLHFNLHMPGPPEESEVDRYVGLVRDEALAFLEQLK